MSRAYYNENDPKAAAWLRELIKAGHIAPGDVDERSILDVRPHEIAQYTQQHFFAGVGGWSFALRLAEWPDSRPVRTGSCPCQPFSIAGKRLTKSDERHLWPNFRDLITFGEHTITFGEQVASTDGRVWLAGVRADLEALGYEVGAADLCAAGVSAPHPRQRLYWMANPRSQSTRRRILRSRKGTGEIAKRASDQSRGSSGVSLSGLVNADSHGRTPREPAATANGHGLSSGSNGSASGLEHATRNGREQRRSKSERRLFVSGCGPWDTCDILPFRDGKFRRVEAGTFPLANGVPDRVGLLRGYGNAIIPLLAAEFIKASLEAINDLTAPNEERFQR